MVYSKVMKPITFSLICALSFIFATSGQCGEDAVKRSFLCTDHNGGQVCIVAADGSIEWSMKAPAPQDCWKLPNGNILFCHRNGAIEATKDSKIVWEYKAAPKTECHACQPLPNGNVMIVECGTSRIIEVDREGKIAKEIKLETKEKSVHNQFRGTRKLANGHYVVCFKGDHKVVEIDGDGKVLKEIAVPGDVHGALVLPDTHLLVTCGDGHKVVEYDAEGKVVWELNENDLPGNPLRLMAGAQRLPNGNTIFCNYLGHGHIGKQPMVFEITRDKKVVWEFADHAHFKTINQIQALEVPGDVTKGEILR